ncbi:unnamed protein product, partial [Staurois parvus]
MRGSTIPVLSSWVCTPAVPIMRGSHHPCAVPIMRGSHHPSPVPIMRGSHHPCTEFLCLYTRCAHYEGFPPSLCLMVGPSLCWSLLYRGVGTSLTGGHYSRMVGPLCL